MRFWIALLFAGLSTGCLHYPGPTSSPRVVNLLGGQETFELVKLPALAQVQMIQTSHQPASGEGSTHGWKIASAPTRPTDPTLKRLSEILTSDATYNFEIAKACEFQADVALRFNGVKKSIDLVFCLTCNEMQVYEGEKMIGHAYFDPAADEIHQLLRERRN